MRHKDFYEWNQLKAYLDLTKPPRYFREREIWWTSIGVNIGDEENGKGNKFARPVLVVRKFNTFLFYGLPLSTSSNRGAFYYELEVKGVISVVLLSQMRAYDARRLLSKHVTVDARSMNEIKCKLGKLIGIRQNYTPVISRGEPEGGLWL